MNDVEQLCNLISNSLEKLKHYIEDEGFKGYDPYDTLNSKIRLSKFGKWIPILAIQFQKRNPINIRPLLGIKKDYNPKAIGLLLQAYSILYKLNPSFDIKKTINFLFHWLLENYSTGYSGYCWGYNFDWASPVKYLKAFTPSMIVSGYIGKGVFEYYKATGNEKAKETLVSICDFILNDLPIFETDNGICLSYTPIMRDCCYNANMLGAELLAKVFSITGDVKLLNFAQKAVDFTIACQKEDGRWNYSMDLISKHEREQIDFHQGFILESLFYFMQHSGCNKEQYLAALKRGLDFYRKYQFYDNGRSVWRLPNQYPTEIHNQAQGIITFNKLSCLNADYLNFAKTIAKWTVENMQDKTGYFYYQKHKYFTNKISYMRWSQAWMILALAELVSKEK